MISSTSNLVKRTKIKRIMNLTAAAETLKLHDKLYDSNLIKNDSNDNINLSTIINNDSNNNKNNNSSQINSSKSNRKLIKFNNLYKSLEVSRFF